MGLELRSERFQHADFAAELLLPSSSESLIDEDEFDRDERLPYWAELWPAAQALSRYLLELPEIPGPVIELGAGVGLPSLALLHRGVAVTATDYYEAALRFAARNASRNGLRRLNTVLLDWRDSKPPIAPAPLVIAADVLYEERNARVLAQLLPRIVSAGGAFILADPGRTYLGLFLELMQAGDWETTALGERLEQAPARGLQTRVRLFRFGAPPR